MAFGKFGRYHPDGADVRVSRFDLVELLRAEVAALREPRVRLETPLEARPLETDPLHVRYVVVNLLHNAVKYSPPGSPVDVTLEPVGDRLLLTVRDCGIGIPQDDLDRLFSPFFRASNVGATPGTGMGLAIVKKSANLISAELAVETAAGAGTTFTVSLSA